MACRVENTCLPLYADLVPQDKREVVGGSHGESPILVHSSSAHSPEENQSGFYRVPDRVVYYRDMSDRV